MKHFKKRITKIVDELITYFFSIGATNININVEEKTDHFEILLKCNYCTKNKTKIDRLSKHLQCEKQMEVEEYYWELAGSSDVDNELALVGMMVDDAKINIEKDSIEIMLYKYK